MCSSGTTDATDMMPNEHVHDSGADVDQRVGPDVISGDFFNTEKHLVCTPQIESDSTSTATAVETLDDNTTDHMSSLRPPTTEPIKMKPKSINPDDMSLNSPSSEIVGTPFAMDNTRFEYPFPDTCGSGSSSTTFDFTPSSSPSSTSFISSGTSRPLTQLSFPPPYHPSYNTTHPKMKLQANPPIPPNLVKRRLRWNLKLGRRKSSAGSQSTTGDESTTASNTDGQQLLSPSDSPIQERVEA